MCFGQKANIKNPCQSQELNPGPFASLSDALLLEY